MRIIFLAFGLVWSSCVFGQSFIDTTSSRGTHSASFSTKELDNATHGKTVETFNRGEVLEIRRSDMKYIHNYIRKYTREKPDVKIPLRSNFYGGFHYKIPAPFQNGTDSLFKQYVDEDGELFLFRVVKLFDRFGSARLTQFHENGNIQYELNYTADTTEFDIYVTGYINIDGEKIGVQDNYLAEDFLKHNKRRKGITPIFDTVYMRVGMLHGKELHYYENGNIKYKGNVHYNLNDGVCTYYHENGQKAVEQHFDKGKRVGTWTAWFENGEVEEYNYFENDLPVGTWKKWHKNGQLIQERTMKRAKDRSTDFRQVKVIINSKEWYSNGQLKKEEKILENFGITKRGNYVEYYSNGQLKEKGKYSTPILSFFYALRTANLKEFREIVNPFLSKNDGLKHKKWVYYKENGEILTTQKYRHGFLKKEKPIADELEIFDYFNPPAKEHCRLQINLHVPLEANNHYEEKTYCVNRREIEWTDTFYNHTVNDLGDSVRYIFEIVHFPNKDGEIFYKRFYPNGQIMADYHYGGNYSAFDEPLKEGWQHSGRTSRNGTATFWYANGQIKWIEESEEIMENFSIAEKRTEYYESGQVKSVSYPDSYDEHIWKTWYENGQLKEEMHYDFNTKEGPQFKWNEKGVLIEKLIYENYKLHGEQFYYNDEGKLIKTEVYEKGKLIKTISPKK